MTWLTTIKNMIPGMAGGVQLLFGRSSPGWESTYYNLVRGDWYRVGQSVIAGFTGVRIYEDRATEFEPEKALNPVDMETAPVAKVLLWTGIAVKLWDKVSGFVGKMLSELT